MSKTDSEYLAYPTYAAGTRPALALEALKALRGEKPDWSRHNFLDRDTFAARVKKALAAANINVGPDKAKKIADRVLNDIHHATRKMNKAKLYGLPLPNAESPAPPQSNAA